MRVSRSGGQTRLLHTVATQRATRCVAGCPAVTPSESDAGLLWRARRGGLWSAADRRGDEAAIPHYVSAITRAACGSQGVGLSSAPSDKAIPRILRPGTLSSAFEGLPATQSYGTSELDVNAPESTPGQQALVYVSLMRRSTGGTR